MEQDKSAMVWGSRTLLEHATALLASVATSVRVVGPDGIPDRHPDRGPVEGVASALEATDTDHNIIVAVDLPLLKPEFFGFLIQEAVTAPLVLCRIHGRIPLCMAVARGMLPALEDYLASGGRSVQGLAELDKAHIIAEERLEAAGFSDAIFTNINTPEDYARYTP